MSETIINQAVEAVMDMIDALGLFALIYRGALGTDNGLSCEVGPTTPETVFLDKILCILHHIERIVLTMVQLKSICLTS